MFNNSPDFLAKGRFSQASVLIADIGSWVADLIIAVTRRRTESLYYAIAFCLRGIGFEFRLHPLI